MSEAESTEADFLPEDESPDAEPEADLGAEIEDLAVRLKAAVKTVDEMVDQVGYVRWLLRQRTGALMFVGRDGLDTLFEVRGTTRRIGESLKRVRGSDRVLRSVAGLYARPGRR
jgi:hypothetical protein